MTPTRQTIFVADHPKGYGNCQSAAMASVLDLPLSEVIDTTSDECRDRGFWPPICAWLAGETLPGLPSDFKDFLQEDLSPLEQVDVLFHDFVSGENFAYYERSHSMTPFPLGVWELKTTDVRFFGWFHVPRCFVIANVDTKARCLEFPGLAGGYRDNTVFRRQKLDLDEPKFITGEYEDVL